MKAEIIQYDGSNIEDIAEFCGNDFIHTPMGIKIRCFVNKYPIKLRQSDYIIKTKEGYLIIYPKEICSCQKLIELTGFIFGKKLGFVYSIKPETIKQVFSIVHIDNEYNKRKILKQLARIHIGDIIKKIDEEIDKGTFDDYGEIDI